MAAATGFEVKPQVFNENDIKVLLDTYASLPTHANFRKAYPDKVTYENQLKECSLVLTALRFLKEEALQLADRHIAENAKKGAAAASFENMEQAVRIKKMTKAIDYLRCYLGDYVKFKSKGAEFDVEETCRFMTDSSDNNTYWRQADTEMNALSKSVAGRTELQAIFDPLKEIFDSIPKPALATALEGTTAGARGPGGPEARVHATALTVASIAGGLSTSDPVLPARERIAGSKMSAVDLASAGIPTGPGR